MQALKPTHYTARVTWLGVDTPALAATASPTEATWPRAASAAASLRPPALSPRRALRRAAGSLRLALAGPPGNSTAASRGSYLFGIAA